MSLADRFELVVPGGAPKRMIVNLLGRPKVGKSSWALGCPGPIYFMEWDPSIEDLSHVINSKEVYVMDYWRDLPIIENLTEEAAKATGQMFTMDEAAPVWDRFIGDLKIIIEEGEGGTLVWDTAARLYQVMRVVMLDQVAQARSKKKSYRFDYGKAFEVWRRLLHNVRTNPNLNHILISPLKKEFKGDGWTGGWNSVGCDEDSYACQVEVVLSKDEEGHHGEITSCRFDSSLEGQVLDNLSYETLAGLLGVVP